MISVCKFGGGLERFRSVETEKKQNECREIVEVPGGSEWKIRRLQDHFPNYCWKYPGCSVIVHYYFNRLEASRINNKNNDDAEEEVQKLFYAKVSHFMSPTEISLQPKYLHKPNIRMMHHLNNYYNNKKGAKLVIDQVFANVACAVNVSSLWHRGKIVQISGSEHVVVELVDIGTQVLVSRENIRPLIKRFGRAPPLCLKCRVDGISINDLETKDLISFKNIVESCNGLFRVELKSTKEPYLIDLYHPTLTGHNVCARFFPAPEDRGKIERLQRNWITHINKITDQFETDEDDYWNHHWSKDKNKSNDNSYKSDSNESLKVAERQFVKRLDKCEKAPRFETDDLIVSHVESSQLVYLQYQWQWKNRKKIENDLKANWSSLENVNTKYFCADFCCAILVINKKQYRRCVIAEVVDNDNFTILYIDYGIYEVFNSKNNVQLKFLPNEKMFNEPPMVTIVSISGTGVGATPHYSETVTLRDILRVGAKVHFKWDKKTKNTPLRGLLFTKDSKDVRHLLTKRLIDARIDLRCREIVKYVDNPIGKTRIMSTFVYRTQCHHHYSKGSMELIQV